jgi:hypothetical protein
LLGKKTKQLLVGKVAAIDPAQNSAANQTYVALLRGPAKRNDDDFIVAYNFSIVAPALNNYTYNVLSIVYGLMIYPVIVTSRGKVIRRCDDEEAYLDAIQSVFESEEIRKLISALMMQLKIG